MKQKKYISFGNNPAFKYQYNLAFYVCTGKLLYLPISNFYAYNFLNCWFFRNIFRFNTKPLNIKRVKHSFELTIKLWWRYEAQRISTVASIYYMFELSIISFVNRDGDEFGCSGRLAWLFFHLLLFMSTTKIHIC